MAPKIEDAKAFSGAVRAPGEREWAWCNKTITPYCFRHAAASGMRSSGLDHAAISQAPDML
jgi:hypothetical protein